MGDFPISHVWWHRLIHRPYLHLSRMETAEYFFPSLGMFFVGRYPKCHCHGVKLSWPIDQQWDFAWHRFQSHAFLHDEIWFCVSRMLPTEASFVFAAENHGQHRGPSVPFYHKWNDFWSPISWVFVDALYLPQSPHIYIIYIYIGSGTFLYNCPSVFRLTCTVLVDVVGDVVNPNFFFLRKFWRCKRRFFFLT